MDKITEYNFAKKPMTVELFKQLKSLKKLNINAEQFQEYNIMNECNHIEELICDSIPHIPIQLKSLKKLTINRVIESTYHEFIPFMKCCQSLETFKINIPFFNTIPQELFPSSLLHLDVNANLRTHVYSILDLTHCTKLKNLTINGTKDKIDIKFPPNLTHLNINNCNTIINTSDLKHLVILNLDGISKWTGVINSLNLKELKIINSNLTELPSGIEKLNLLEELNLNNNQITTVPHYIFSLKKLTKIYLTNNLITQIQEIPYIQYSSVNTIDISNNNLSIIPSYIYNLPLLETLTAINNKLTFVFNGLNKQSDMNTVNFRNNFITDVKDVFKYLPLLKYLTLSDNYITILPDINQLISLSTLVITGNKITKLPDLITCPLHGLFYDGDENVVVLREKSKYTITKQTNKWKLLTVQPQPKYIPKSQSQPQHQPQSQPQPQIQPQIQSQPQIQPQIQSQPQSQPQIQSQIQSQPQPVTIPTQTHVLSKKQLTHPRMTLERLMQGAIPPTIEVFVFRSP